MPIQLSNPRVSVIMPSYNTASLIAASLDSVLQQTFQDFEIIVVNDGSPDTPQLEQVLALFLENHGDKITYIKQQNKRAAGARNTAIRQARGELLAFLDSDDSWLPGHLAAQINLFDQNPGIGLAYSNGLALRNSKRPFTFMEKCPSLGPADFEALVLERCQIPISTVVARKKALVDAGMFDETLQRCDDYDMWLRMAFGGSKIAYTANVQVRLNGGRPGSLSASRVKMAEAYWIILEKALQTLPLAQNDRILVQNRAAEIRAQYLREEGKYRLQQREFDRAKSCLREANSYAPRWKVTLTLMGLAIAPIATGKVASWVESIQGWRVRYLLGRS